MIKDLENREVIDFKYGINLLNSKEVKDILESDDINKEFKIWDVHQLCSHFFKITKND